MKGKRHGSPVVVVAAACSAAAATDFGPFLSPICRNPSSIIFVRFVRKTAFDCLFVFLGFF